MADTNNPLPTADQAFGSSLPTADEAFGEAQTPELSAGGFSDYFFTHTSLGKVLNAFGQGAKDNWGSQPVGLSKETSDLLAKAGVINDYQNNRTSVLKSFNEALIRPAVTATDIALRSASALFGGAENVAAEVGQQVGAPEAGKAAAGMIEWFGQTGAPEFAVSPAIHEARSVGAVGESEGTYFGTKEPTPDEIEGRNQALSDLAQQRPVQNNIHDVARKIAPDVFQNYDNLSAYKDRLRETLSNLGDARLQGPEAVALQGKIDSILDKVGGVDSKLTKAAAGRLSDAEEQLQSFLSSDTDEMSDIRKQMLDTDYQLRDLAPDVSSAYKAAADQIGMTPESPTEAPTAPSESPEGVSTGEPSTGVSEAPTGSEGPSNISQDVSGKLVEAGRPQEEADAAGKLVQAYYETRADRFGGKKGSALDLYNKEFPSVEGTGRLSKKGSLTINEGKNTLRLFKNADASTFLHETGHQWLEDMMNDSKDPEAPFDLQSDAKTVRDWLGAKEDAAISRKQHEKFARGFERYMMEGVAPSKQLASVFSKFKDWLSKIYKTVLDLKAPITDDIRDVFDRLLSTAPEKAYISPTEEPNFKTNPFKIADEHQMEVTRLETEAMQKAYSRPVAEEKVEGVESQNQPFEDKETEYVDKAGNIRLDNLNSTEDLNQCLKDIAEQNKDFIEARKGQVSSQDIINLAESAGLNPDKLNKNIELLRQISVENNIPLASMIYGLRKVLIQSAQELMKIIKEGDDPVAYAEAVTRHTRIQETLSGITAEWGRAGHAFRMMAEEAEKAQQLSEFLKDNIGKTLYQIQEEMKAGKYLDTPAKVSGFVSDMRKPSLGEMMLEAFRNWLISGPITHTTYAVGNKLYALYKALPETAARATVGAIREAVEGKPVERVRFGEIKEGMYAMFFGQRDGLRAAWESFKAGQTVPLEGEGTIADLAIKKAMGEGLEGKALRARINELKANPTPSMIEAVGQPYTPFTKTQYIPGVAGTIIRAPGERLVAPIHSFDRTVGYLTNKAALIYRQAVSEGHTGDALARRIAELRNNTPDEITAAARQEATEQALMGKTGDFTRRWTSFVRWETEFPGLGRIQPLSFVDPFVNVFSNINRAALMERSPLGLLSKDVRDSVLGKKGKFAQDTAIAKITLGTALAGTVGGLVMEGMMNPGAPADYHEAAINEMANGLPHSIRIGDMTYQVNKLGVVGTMLAFYSDMFATAGVADKEGLAKAAAFAFHATADNFLSEGFMSGLADLLRAVEDPDRNGAYYLRNFFATAAVPFSVGMSQLTRVQDPYKRDYAHIPAEPNEDWKTYARRQMLNEWEQIKTKIPGLSETLYPKIDVFGQPIPNKEFRGVYAEQASNDPVIQAMKASGYFPAPVKRSINGVPLTEKQYMEFAMKAGRLAKFQLNMIVNMPAFSSLPAPAKHELMKDAIENSRKNAAAWLQIQPGNENIMQQAIANKKALITGTTQ